jgi:hypothetical protein
MARVMQDGGVNFWFMFSYYGGSISGQFLNRQPHHRRNPRARQEIVLQICQSPV